MKPPVETIKMTSIDENGNTLVETIIMKAGSSEEAAFFTREGDGIEISEAHLAVTGASIMIPRILNPRYPGEPRVYH